MKKLLGATALLATLFAFSLAPTATTPVAGTPSSVTDACPIRLLATGPVLLTDTAHRCSDQFTSVHVDPTSGILVVESATPAGRIMSCIAGADETLVQRGVSAGASVGTGLSVINITFGRNNAFLRADSTYVTGSSANIWLICVTEML